MNLDPILTRSNLDYLPQDKKCGGQFAQTWPVDGKQICYPVLDLVTMRGGEFFYIPSLPFIDSLGS